MARPHSHLIASRVVRPHEFNRYEPDKPTYTADAEFLIAACGQEYRAGAWGEEHQRRYWSEDASRVSCPRCRAKIAKAALKARPADAPKLTLEKAPEAKGGFRYQQGWRALVDGEAVAILGFEEHSWHIYPFVARKQDDSDEVKVVNTHGVLTTEGTTASRGLSRLPSSALCYKTKEDALLAAGDLRVAGKLKTAPELLREYAENVAWLAKRRAERQREEAETDQRNRETLEALREILEKETLSNFQREGLMTAIVVFEKRVKPASDTDEAA